MFVTSGYELKGGSEDYGGRFKKWKFVLNWYEGVPSPDVILKFFEKENLENLTKLLDKINENSQEYNGEGERVVPYK